MEEAILPLQTAARTPVFIDSRLVFSCQNLFGPWQIARAVDGEHQSFPENPRLSKQLILIAAVLYSHAAASAAVLGATVYVQLFPLTGEVRFTNRDATPFSFVLYSIKSTSGALNGSASVWKSISDNYDVSGNGFIDPLNNWVKVKALPTELTEGEVPDPGGTLAPFRSISLGKIWNPHTAPNPALDLSFSFTSASGPQPMVQVDYAIDGDYNGDHKVDISDYQDSWKPFFGSTFALTADGNLNGVVDAADYTVWRDHLGTVLPSPPFAAIPGSGSGAALLTSAVPEPTSLVLSLLAAAGTFVWRIRRHRNPGR
jgi:PEP-CTERM motif